MGFLSKRLADEERAEELFSPYIDGQVTDEEHRFLERYLVDHPQTREKLELLTAAVQLTKSLPPVKAPRSFVLPRSMARRPALVLRWYPVMRLATVAAIALFAFAFTGDLATQSRFAPASPVVENAASDAARMAEAAEPTPAPPEAAAVAPTGAAMPTQPAAAASTSALMPTPPPAPASGAEANKTVEATSTPEAMSLQAAAPTPAATVQAETAQPEQKTLVTSAAAPATLQLDPLRLAWIVLAGLALSLTAATLILRRRI